MTGKQFYHLLLNELTLLMEKIFHVVLGNLKVFKTSKHWKIS